MDAEGPEDQVEGDAGGDGGVGTETGKAGMSRPKLYNAARNFLGSSEKRGKLSVLIIGSACF